MGQPHCKTLYVEEIQRPLLNLVPIVTFYLVGDQVLGAVVAYIPSMMAGIALALRYLKGIFPKLLDRSTPPEFEARALCSASAPMALAQFMPRVNSWVATFVLGILPAASAVGILSIVTRTAALSALVFRRSGSSRIWSPASTAKATWNN